MNYYAKMYDSLNCEYEELRQRYAKCYAAQIHALLMSKRKGIRYAIVEDEEFNRYGWFENGEKICE